MTDSAVPLPELETGELDGPTLDALFRDLSACAQIGRVVLKHGRHDHTPDTEVSLAAARDALCRGTAIGARIDYRYDGEVWSDVVMRRGTGFRLVRMRQDSFAAPST